MPVADVGMDKARIDVKVKIPIALMNFLKAMEDEGFLEQTVKEYLEWSLIQVILADINAGSFGDPKALKKKSDLQPLFKKHGYHY